MTNQEKPATKALFNNSHDLLLHETCALGDDGKLEELGSFIRGGKIDDQTEMYKLKKKRIELD